jgi:hypothetical protein
VRAGDRFRFRAALALEPGPDAGEGEQRPVIVEGEPHHVLLFSHRFGSGAYSEKRFAGTRHLFSGFSQPRQCTGDRSRGPGNRRAEVAIHHHIADAYLLRYAQGSSWREDNRRVSNGDQVSRVASLAMKRGKSVDFRGYWQRHVAQ